MPGTKTRLVREIGPTKGKATPMAAPCRSGSSVFGQAPGRSQGRGRGDDGDYSGLGANPGTLFEDGVTKVRETSLTWEGGKPVVTFPIPGVPGATATATLDAKYMAESVVVRQGATTTEFTYGDYQDWNNPLNKIEVFYAGKMMERRNGAVVRDMTTEVTETGNVYVVVPVPASVRRRSRPRRSSRVA